METSGTSNSSNLSVGLVTDSLEYYDKNAELNSKIYKNIKYVRFQSTDKDNEHNKISVYRSDKSKLFESRYEILGVYNAQAMVWTWAWSIPNYTKNLTNISRKIVLYGMDVSPENLFLKTELITSRFRISNPVQLDIHMAISSYLSKKPSIYKYKYYKTFEPDDDGLVDITNFNEADSDDYTIYIMVLLDVDPDMF